MTMASTLRRHLESRGVEYQVVNHPMTASSSETAQSAHVSGNRIAKSVVLRDGEGYLLAVLPAAHHLSLEMLQDWLGRSFALASEQEIGRLFPDCELGAIPPLGGAYDLDVVLDERLARLDEVYFEGGDHQTLVRIGGEQFRHLMASAKFGRFSTHD
ncbi:MAG TPA: YbaK/EbsC family protein [Geminicoccaceae bacterium]|nr:YbaK/EbsC family protein [Geminicoccaceae bacterium]